MATHRFTGELEAGPEAVFDYLADITHLPAYLPLMTAARDLGDGRLAMDTEVKGATHTVDAWWRLDRARRRIDWGSEREAGYHGWLVVAPAPTGAGSEIRYGLTTPRDHTLEPYLRAATTFLSNALAGRD
jgi:hypothetical protein